MVINRCDGGCDSSCALQKLVSMRDSAGVQAACMQLGPQMQEAALALRTLAALGVASRTEDATGVSCPR